MIPTFLTTFPATTKYKSPVKLEYIYLCSRYHLCVFRVPEYVLSPGLVVKLISILAQLQHFHTRVRHVSWVWHVARCCWILLHNQLCMDWVSGGGCIRWYLVINFMMFSLQYLQPTGWLRVIAPLYRVIKTECTFKFTTMLSTNISISPHGSCHQWHPVKASPTSWPDQHPVCGLLIRVKIRTIKTPPASTLYCIFQW